MKIIGLTGGIGSGKSTVARILEELGAVVIDADRVAHEAYAPGTPGWSAVVDAFGAEVVAADGTIDRKKLGAMVFADPEARMRLNRIMHPLVDRELRRRLLALRQQQVAGPVVIEAALLIEAGWAALVDQVWLVVAPPEAVVQRLTEQRGMEASDVEARRNAQLDDETRKLHAHVVIENSGSLEELRAKVEHALRQDC